MIITAKYGSHHFSGYGENAIKSFSHYKSVGAFCCNGNQTKRQITTILAILNCPYKQHLYQIRVILLQWFWRSCHLSFFFNLMLLWQQNTRDPRATTRSPEWNRHCRYADGMQHFSNTVRYWNLWQGNGLNSFWDILLTRLKWWNFQNAISKKEVGSDIFQKSFG